MTSAPLLDHLDPRIGLRAAPANLNDQVTRAAIRVLTNALGALGDRAVCAPAFGMPVRIIAVRLGDLIHYVLNPTIESASDFFLSKGETSPHTDKARRDVMRARKVIIQGTGLSGASERLELQDDVAITAQKAFDLMDNPAPFGWMTPFHHIWMRLRGAPQAARFETICGGLYATGHSGPNNIDSDLRFTSANQVSISMPPGTQLAEIDALNPMRPVSQRDQLLLTLLLGMAGMRHVFVADAQKFGLAVATLLIAPGLIVHTGGGHWPTSVTERLGLTSAIKRHAFDVHNFPESPGIAPEIDAVILDQIAAPTTNCIDGPALTNIARALSGASGALLIVVPTVDSMLTARLQQNFAAVYTFPLAGEGLVYVARKTVITPEHARSRLLSATTRLGMPDLIETVISGGLLLRKDGREDAV